MARPNDGVKFGVKPFSSPDCADGRDRDGQPSSGLSWLATGSAERRLAGVSCAKFVGGRLPSGSLTRAEQLGYHEAIRLVKCIGLNRLESSHRAP